MHRQRRTILIAAAAASVLALTSKASPADVVTDWNERASLIASADPGPRAEVTMALVQVAVFDAVNAITGRYPPSSPALEAPPDASVDAAVAAANRVVLSKLMPSRQATIDDAYRKALGEIPASGARQGGIAVGEAAAASVLKRRSNDSLTLRTGYRPHTSPGTYVPTAIPVFSTWPQRTPWTLERAGQYRPGPPPSLSSDRWVRDFEEVKALGARENARRTPAQTESARVWETTAPPIYFQIAQSVTRAPNRDITRNARLLAAVAQAMDDALIAVFDAKYAYGFWRPITAIRNGDLDGNSKTARDAFWLPLIDTPMHPEYPCAHCTLAGAVGAVLEADIGTDPVPPLRTASPTAPGVTRTWRSIDDFVAEVSEARISAGVHYRNSAEVGTALGKRIGERTAKRLNLPLRP